MNRERYQKLMQLIDQLIDRPVEERPAILDQFCNGDDSLRREAEQLLAQQSSASGFLEHSPLEALTDAQSDSMIGRHAGPYRIVKPIGRGGMGAVYKAVRDDDEYQTEVAIKLIKRGMDTDYILRRFRNERQILANLNHPNIARLLDGGTTENGLPYFVMEHVDGEPIDDYCAKRNLPIADRLKLFRAVCSAVQYAHQNLVIHRDLKPSNILVTGDGTPKLLDFGIAKLLQTDGNGSATELTATELRVMTPHYASPEQVKGAQITTASDVYSLGVVLYELLTGRRPYRFKTKAPDEVGRVICEQEPERPSKAASGQQPEVSESETPASVGRSSARQIPTRRDADLRGDLDAIVLMALRKEPARRYSSVEQFSEDLRRHLDRLPVRAHRDSFKYRSAKFVRRHKVAVGAAVMIALTLTAGAVATAWQARVARVERAKAERRFNDVRRLANSFMFEVYDEVDKSPTQAKQLLVKRALEYLDSLSQEAGGDIELQRELATAYFRIATVQGGHLSASLGDTKGAFENHRKALTLREKLIALDPNNAELRRELAESYSTVGLLLLNALSKPQEARESFRQALEILEPLSAADPKNMKVLKELTAIYFQMGMALGGGTQIANTGDAKLALEYYRKASRIGEAILAQNPANIDNRQRLGATYSNIGLWMSAHGTPAEALENYQKALAIDEAVVAEQSTSVIFRRELAVQHSNIAASLLLMGDKAGSLDHARKALVIYDALVAEDKNNMGARKDLAIGYRNVGKALAAMTDAKAAAEQFRKAIEIFEDLLRQDAANAYNRRQLAFTHLQTSQLLATRGDLIAAINQAGRAIAECETLVAANPKNSSAQRTLADSYAQMGKCHALLAAKAATAKGKQRAGWQEARKWFQKSLHIWQAMRDQGTLSNADAGKPEELAKEISKSDAALTKSY